MSQTFVLERLATLSVADIMQGAVVTVSAHQSLASAAQVLSQHGVSGAPVVDESWRCVGMLSATDFVRQEAAAAHEERGAAPGPSHRRPAGRAGEVVSLERADEPLVADWMSPAVQEVSPAATLVDAARIMCAAHLHRLPVLDATGHPVGMITSLDIVAALANAADESDSSRRPPR